MISGKKSVHKKAVPTGPVQKKIDRTAPFANTKNISVYFISKPERGLGRKACSLPA
jgi:hypothetical protein